MLALDVDGTLLDQDGTLRPSTAAAVARAAEAGIQPVLCTGRRYRRALPIARQLGIDAPLVCNSGTIVKDPRTHRTLWRADFDDSLAMGVFDLFRGHDQPSVVFTDRGPEDFDFIIAAFPTGREHFDDYVCQNREHAEIDTSGPRGAQGRSRATLFFTSARSALKARCSDSRSGFTSDLAAEFKHSFRRSSPLPWHDVRAIAS